jgi:Protein of unknown function (DUF3147)
MDLLVRFITGGIVVSLFALIGGVLRPKSFVGLLAAAPSVALATITLTVMRKGPGYAAIEARSMIFGAAAFLIYAVIVSPTLFRTNHDVLSTTAVSLIAWFGITFLIEALL